MEVGGYRRAHHWSRWSSERSQIKSRQVNQLLYPLELSSERLPGRPDVDLDLTVPAFRPRRHAAAVARVRIRDLAKTSTNSSRLDNEHYCEFHKELNNELRTL